MLQNSPEIEFRDALNKDDEVIMALPAQIMWLAPESAACQQRVHLPAAWPAAQCKP